MHLSKQIECMIHHLKLVFPENDHEMVPLINSVDALIEHHLEFPFCKFVEVYHA